MLHICHYIHYKKRCKLFWTLWEIWQFCFCFKTEKNITIILETNYCAIIMLDESWCISEFKYITWNWNIILFLATPTRPVNELLPSSLDICVIFNLEYLMIFWLNLVRSVGLLIEWNYPATGNVDSILSDDSCYIFVVMGVLGWWVLRVNDSGIET